MNTRETNQLAKQLLGIFMYEGNSSRIDYEWSRMGDEAKAAWIRVAEYVSEMLAQYIVLYGYNGNGKFQSELERLID